MRTSGGSKIVLWWEIWLYPPADAPLVTCRHIWAPLHPFHWINPGKIRAANPIYFQGQLSESAARWGLPQLYFEGRGPSPPRCSLLTPSPFSPFPIFRLHTRHICKPATQGGHTSREQNVYFSFQETYLCSPPSHMCLERKNRLYSHSPKGCLPNLPWEVGMWWVVELVL